MLNKISMLRACIVIAVLFSTAAESLSAAGMPQLEADLKPVVESRPRPDPNLKLPFDDVEVFHDRMRCEIGETKHLIIGGFSDGFALPIDAYTIGQPIANFPNTGGYDSTQFDRHFFERLEVPSLITEGYLLFALRSNGTSHQTNDTIYFGNRSAGLQNPAISLTDLSTSGFQSTGNLNAVTGAQYLASLSSIDLGNGQSMLQYINGGYVTTAVDTYLQDDTSIDYIAYSVCSKAEAVIDAAVECSGKDVEIDSYYGPQTIKEYCFGDPIVLSTAGTTPSDNYFVELQKFDPVQWQGLPQPLHPGAWVCASGVSCPPPAHIMPADYNGNPPGQPIDANDIGEIYHFKFAVGPVWAEDHHFFRVKQCHDSVGDERRDMKRVGKRKLRVSK